MTDFGRESSLAEGGREGEGEKRERERGGEREREYSHKGRLGQTDSLADGDRDWEIQRKSAREEKK